MIVFLKLFFWAFTIRVCVPVGLNTHVVSGEDDMPDGDGPDAGVSLIRGGSDPASPAALVQKADRLVLDTVAVRSSKNIYPYWLGFHHVHGEHVSINRNHGTSLTSIQQWGAPTRKEFARIHSTAMSWCGADGLVASMFATLLSYYAFPTFPLLIFRRSTYIRVLATLDPIPIVLEKERCDSSLTDSSLSGWRN